MIRHVLINGPGHYLKNRTVEWRREARVEVIQVHASPHDLNKLRKRAASYGQPGFIGSQVAGDDVRRTWHHWTKISTAAEVRRRIDYRRLAKVRISARQELSDRRAGAVALIAGDVRVDDIAA